MARLIENTQFIRLFVGRIVTNLGDSMYFIAAMWLVWEMTGSTFYTGLAGFLVRVPSSLQFLFGPLVDHWSLRRLLVGTQLIQGVSVLAIPIAAAADVLSIWLVLAIMPVLTLLNQLVYPAQSSALPRLVEEENLVRANSLFSSAYRSVNMLSNAASGALIAVIGAISLYLIDAATFGIAAFIFVGLTISNSDTGDSGENVESEQSEDEESYLNRLLDGFRYIRGTTLVSLLIIAMAVNFGYGVMMAVLPAYADHIGGPETYGLIMAAEGAGGLIGAAGVSYIDDHSIGNITIIGYIISAVCWLGALVVPGLYLTLALFFVSFVPVGAVNVLDASLTQAAVHDDLLGRVLSVESSVSTLILPVGMLVGGAIASQMSVVTVMAFNGIALGAVSVYFLVFPTLRNLPEIDNVTSASLGLDYLESRDGGTGISENVTASRED